MTRPTIDRRALLGSGLTGAAAAALSPGLLACAPPPKDGGTSGPPAVAEYAARDYSGLIGAVPKFSETLLKNHFTLYQGYVKNTNLAVTTLAEMAKENKLGTPAAAEIRRRFGWEFNGMRLHELYFENLGGKEPLKADGKVGQAIVKSFGSVDAWMADFKAVGAMRGIGWAALVQDGWSGRLFNTWINEHDGGHLGACPIVLIMDVFEHAYLTDFGVTRKDYIDAFCAAIHWGNVEKRI